MGILNQHINYFPKAIAKEETPEYFGTKIILREILTKMQTEPEHIRLISTLRSIKDEKEQKAFKNSMLPCFMISGYFEKDGKGSRTAEDLEHLTGLICIDLDPKDPAADLKELKQNIKEEPFVAYVGDSCRGEGIFAIVHVSEPERHLEYFDFFVKWLDANGCKNTFDKQTKNLNRLRFIAPDPDHYINDNTIPLDLPIIKQPKKKTHPQKSFNSRYNQYTSSTNKFEIAVKILIKQGQKFEEGNKHNYLFHFCCILNKMGVTEQEAESYISTLYPLSSIKSNCISYPYQRYSNEFGTWNFQREEKYTFKEIPPSIREVKIQPNPKTESIIHSEPKMISIPETTPSFLSDEEDIQPIPKDPSNQWNIAEIETFYANAILPTTPIKLDNCTQIIDVKLFVESQLEYVRANNGKRIFLPHLERLQKLKELLSDQK